MMLKLLSIMMTIAMLLLTLPVHGDEVLQQNMLIIDGDVEAVQFWEEWSNYENANGNIVHNDDKLSYFGKQMLVFNNFMYRKYQDGWKHLSTEHMQIVVRNVYQYVIAFTGFEYSTITIEDCKNVVLGIKFTNPENTDESIGWLYNTQITIQGFGNVTFFNYDWVQSQGTPITVEGGSDSRLEFLGTELNIESETLTKEPGLIVRNVRSLILSANYMFIGGYTPALVLENVKDMLINRELRINNIYYSYSSSSWSHGGTGILAKTVSYVEQGNSSAKIKIENCHIGIAFEDDGKHEALNNSPYVSFYDCDQDYAYNYAYYIESASYPAILQGIQALTSIFVSLAWIRVGVLYFSSDETKKKLAKELFLKVAVGTIIVAMLVFGYQAVMSLVSWVFGT